jgi:hypothetical protein
MKQLFIIALILTVCLSACDSPIHQQEVQGNSLKAITGASTPIIEHTIPKLNLATSQKETLLERRDKAMVNINQSLDDMQNITFFHHKESPETLSKDFIEVYAGIENSDDSPFLRVRINYANNQRQTVWLNIAEYIIKTDQATYNVFPYMEDMHHENDAYKTYETLDYLATTDDLNMLLDIAMSKSVKTRYVGQTYHHDRIVTNREKKAILDMLYIHIGNLAERESY